MFLEVVEFLELLLVLVSGVHGDDLVAADADSAKEGGALVFRWRRHWCLVCCVMESKIKVSFSYFLVPGIKERTLKKGFGRRRK